MKAVFSLLLESSAAVGLLILAVILARALLRRAPRGLLCLLWVPVALRLLLPFPLRSGLSLIPRAVSQETVAAWTEDRLRAIPIPGPLPEAEPEETTASSPAPAAPVKPAEQTPASPRRTADPLTIAARVWAGGTALMLVYAGWSYLRLRRMTAVSAPVQRGVRICDGLRSPFILGLFRPRIYLPSDLAPEECETVLAHENAHLRRRDQIWKPLGYLLLCVWWFHPLVWAAYLLFCRDLELACDERVVRELDSAGKKAYAETLLRCGMPRHGAAACPLAFGETGLKARVRAVLSYKKPAFWIILAVIAALVVLLVCFLTEPKGTAAEPDSAVTEQSEGAETPPDDGEPQSGTMTPMEIIQTVVPVYLADAARVQAFGTALQKLAEDFDAAGMEPNFENLNAFLKSRPDFNTLDADTDVMVALLRQGFTVDSTRERMLVHYAMALFGMAIDMEKYPNLTAGLDTIAPLTDAQYPDLLAAIAAHREPLLTEMTGQMFADRRQDVADPALRVLLCLYPGCGAESGELIYPAVRADGEQIEVVCITEVLDYAKSGKLRINFRLSDRRRTGFWSYEIEGDRVTADDEWPTSGWIPTADPGDSYGDVLEEIWNGHLVTLDVGRAVFEETAAQYADLPFDPSPITLLGEARQTVVETLGMTDEDWDYLTLEDGQEGIRPNRRVPETVDGIDWTLYLRFAGEVDIQPYLWTAWYEKNLSGMTAAEKNEIIERTYRQLHDSLGDPDLPFGKQTFNYTPIEAGLAQGGFSSSPYGAFWVLCSGLDIPGWQEAVVLCMLTVQSDPNGTALKVEYRLNSVLTSGLARYEQSAAWGTRDNTLATLIGADEDSFENGAENYADFSEPFQNRFGMEIHEFARDYRRAGYTWIRNCYEPYPFEKKDAMTVDGVRYDVRLWADGRYAGMDPLLCHADYTPAEGEEMTMKTLGALAETLTAQYGLPMEPRFSVRPVTGGTKPLYYVGDSKAWEALELADGIYQSVWLVNDHPDYPVLPEDYYPAQFHPWSRNVEAATLTAVVRGGKLSYTLAFDVKSLRALPVDYAAMEP